MGRKFLLKTDNMSLKYLFEQPDLNTRQARWLAFLSEYHFELKHIKCKENKVADALSQRNDTIYEVTLSQTNADLHERIRTTNILTLSRYKSSRKSKRTCCFNNKKNTRLMNPDCYGPRIACMFQREGTISPAPAQNFI